MRQHPHVYEVNALIFLRRLSTKHGRALSLASVPEDEWLRFKRMGFDFVWLMGVWRRSVASRQEALRIAGLREEYGKALPNWTEKDVVGSPYAICNYTLDPALGQEGELQELKSRLTRIGLGLMLDFVPNHMARDHPWTLTHPDWLIRGDADSLGPHPDWFYSPGGDITIAHGKDPYFSPWTDTAQLNYRSTGMRDALTQELMKIVEVSDSVRCDMSMLVLNKVFEQTWGWASKNQSIPQSEFWTDAISQAKKSNGDFLFLGEAYWGLGRELQQMGFDFTYDKTLYDKLVASDPGDVREHLKSEESYQKHLARFIENHDEPRAATAFGINKSRAAAIVMATVPGLRLFHDGQIEGMRVKLPVQLGREPDEAPDSETIQFYERLLKVCNGELFHEGDWVLLDVGSAWEGNESHYNLLAWRWQKDSQDRTVVVNYSPDAAQGRVRIPVPANNNDQVELLDELNGISYSRDVNELNNPGLYVDLAPWNAHIFAKEQRQ